MSTLAEAVDDGDTREHTMFFSVQPARHSHTHDTSQVGAEASSTLPASNRPHPTIRLRSSLPVLGQVSAPSIQPLHLSGNLPRGWCEWMSSVSAGETTRCVAYKIQGLGHWRTHDPNRRGQPWRQDPDGAALRRLFLEVCLLS